MLLLLSTLAILSRIVTTQAVMQAGVAGEVRSSARGVDFVFRTPPPRESQIFVGDRPVMGITAAGLGDRIEAGKPVVPMRRLLVEVPARVSVSLRAGVDSERWIPTTGLDVAPVVTRGVDGEMLTTDATAVWDSPEAWARLEFVGWFRDRRVACVAVSPVKVQSPAGGAHVAELLHLNLDFGAPGQGDAEASLTREADGPFRALQQKHIVNFGAYAAATLGNESAVHRAGAQSASTPTQPVHPNPAVAPLTQATSADADVPSIPRYQWILKAEVNTAGLYAIDAAQLTAAGIRIHQVAPQRLVMLREGRVYPVIVEGESDGVLAPSERILFYGEPATGPYTRVNAYFLAQLTDEPGPEARMSSVSGAQIPTAPVQVYFRDTIRAEVNALYWQLLPNGAGKDHWFWTKTLAPSSKDYFLEIPDPVTPGSGSIDIRAALHGYTDPTQNPDHHTRVSVNGVPVGEATWNGIQPFVHAHPTLPQNVFGGTNIVKVEQLADTGALVDGIYCDFVEVTYDRALNAVDNALTITFGAARPITFAVRKFSNPNITLLEITDPARPKHILGATVVSAGASSTVLTSIAPAESDPDAVRRYHFSADPAVKTPLALTPLAPAVNMQGGADYIVIVPAEFESAVAPLVAHRSSQSLRVKVLTTEQLYDHFGFGVEGPAAVERFLKTGFATWPMPVPRHVVLVGDATIDPLNHLLTNGKNWVPFTFRQILTDGEIPSDHGYACVVGSDPLPELFVSRIPAVNPAEVSAAISKILQRETAPPAGAWKTKVSHFSDKGGAFTFTLDSLAQQSVPAGYVVNPIYADNYPNAAAMHAATVADLTAGSLFATYLGHGATGNWNTYLSTADTPSLTNGGQLPFVVALNCLNGFFASPTTAHSLGEALVLAPNAGAVASWASAGLGFLSQVTAISGHLYEHLFLGETLGAATTGTKLDAYLLSGVLEDNLWQYVMFGDSASPGLVQ